MSEYGDYINERGCCTACGNEVDVGDWDWASFQPDDGGQFADAEGYASYWATGTIPCEHCGARLFMDAVSP